MHIVARIRARIMQATRRGRATTFGQRLFPACQVHAEEAAAVYSLAEAFNGAPLPHLDLDCSFEDRFGDASAVALRGLNIAEVMAVVAAMEKEYGAGRDHGHEQQSDRAAEVLGRVLLGSPEIQSSWDSRTVWSRSIGSVVNERGRSRGGCTCESEAGRPTMQPTKPAQATELRR
jgi:hypothetical protein